MGEALMAIGSIVLTVVAAAAMVAYLRRNRMREDFSSGRPFAVGDTRRRPYRDIGACRGLCPRGQSRRSWALACGAHESAPPRRVTPA